MRVRFLSDYTGPGVAHVAGVVAEIEDADAKTLISKGDAEPAVETAAAGPAEDASADPAKKPKK